MIRDRIIFSRSIYKSIARSDTFARFGVALLAGLKAVKSENKEHASFKCFLFFSNVFEDREQQRDAGKKRREDRDDQSGL